MIKTTLIEKNYKCDITYTTNSELGFDYLRDNMKYSKMTKFKEDIIFQ